MNFKKNQFFKFKKKFKQKRFKQIKFLKKCF